MATEPDTAARLFARSRAAPREAHSDNPSIDDVASDRRRFLIGSAAVVATATIVPAAAALSATSELDSLIAVYDAALADEVRAMTAFNVFDELRLERPLTSSETAEYARRNEVWVASNDTVDAALDCILAHQPRDVAEVRRKCRVVLSSERWIDQLMGRSDMEMLVRSMASAGA